MSRESLAFVPPEKITYVDECGIDTYLYRKCGYTPRGQQVLGRVSDQKYKRFFNHRKGNYLFGLKENQPSLLEDVRLYFENADRKDLDSFQTVEKNTGRIEKRVCRKIKNISWPKEHKWPGLQSVFSIERTLEKCGHSSRETSFYISSCDSSPDHLMTLAREHWKIESMHWLLDVTFSEDDCRFLSENAYRTMNALRKFALTLHKNSLPLNHKKVSIKAHMLSALLDHDLLLSVLRFL